MAKFKSAPNKQVMSENGIIFFSENGELETNDKAFIETLGKCKDVKKVSGTDKPAKKD